MRWNKKFTYKGKPLYYNRIGVNNCAERAIEIPITFHFLANLGKREKLLEVGNVLANYENSLSEYLGLRPRRIIDKFEIDIDVDNVDLMELSFDEKYDAIVSISTVEHIGQGIAPSEAYGEHTTARDLEAPLKAIAKIYELLVLGGKALITVPFGKLADGVWYIQFGHEYLELLETKYNISSKAISQVFMKRVALDISEINTNNPRQIWIEEREGSKLTDVEYNWPWPYANSIAILELMKIEEVYCQGSNNDYASNLLNYEQAIPKPTIYAELLENNFLTILDNLKELNILFGGERCSENEERLFLDLETIVSEFFSHPDRHRITLLIYIKNISVEEANTIVSGVILNILINSDVEEIDESEVVIVGQLSDVQWSALLPCLDYRIVLENGDRQDFIKLSSKFDNIPLCSLDSFKNKRTVRSDTGRWFLR